MRELKFRAWNIKDRYYQEVDGFDLFLADGKLFEVREEMRFYDAYMSRVYVTDQYIVEQYTGLHDKNGEEIYEGDVVRAWENAGPAGDSVQTRVVTIGPFGINLQSWAFDTGNEWATPEVIGNIHENPDLVGGTT